MKLSDEDLREIVTTGIYTPEDVLKLLDDVLALREQNREALKGLRDHMRKQPGIGDVPKGKCEEVARSYFSIGVVTTVAWVDQYLRAALGEKS